MKTGWVEIATLYASTRHYFVNGVALCGKVQLRNKKIKLDNDFDCENNCKSCKSIFKFSMEYKDNVDKDTRSLEQIRIKNKHDKIRNVKKV